MENFILNEQLENEILDLQDEASLHFKKEDWNGMKEIMLVAWDKLPEPKLKYDQSFWVARMMCEAALGEKNVPLAEKWVDIYKVADLERIEGGERFFMEARLAYLKEDFDKAKELFQQADKLSKGRLFQNPSYVEYLKFYKQK